MDVSEKFGFDDSFDRVAFHEKKRQFDADEITEVASKFTNDDDACPLANAMMALRTLKEAYIAEDDPDGAAIAQELWDTASELSAPGQIGAEQPA